MTKEEKRRDIFTELCKRVNYADAALEIYLIMRHGYGETPEKINEVYKIAGTYWAISRKAIFENALLYIYEIYKKIKYYGTLNGVEEIKNIDVIDDQFRKLKEIRDKSLAHFNDEYITRVDELFAKNALDIDTIRKMINLERYACNKEIGEERAHRYYDYKDIENLFYFCQRHL